MCTAEHGAAWVAGAAWVPARLPSTRLLHWDVGFRITCRARGRANPSHVAAGLSPEAVNRRRAGCQAAAALSGLPAACQPQPCRVAEGACAIVQRIGSLGR